MQETVWALILGGMFVAMGIASSLFKRLPLSGAMLYLVAGAILGPNGGNVLSLDIVRDATFVRRASEVALLVSLFAIGLRLRLPFVDKLWTLPARLGLLAMVFTVPLIGAVGVWGLGLTWGPALLLGAMLAPTDPVLAHDVQVRDANDLDRVRFSLSGEGGVNDGIAQPFAYLGLALCAGTAAGGASFRDVLTLHNAALVLWGIVGGAGVGALLGFATTHAVAWLRTRYAQALGLEGFFALGLIALSYGLASLADTFAFLAVFAAGVAMRRVEHRATGERTPQDAIGAIDSSDVTATAADPDKAHAFMTESVLAFTVELERIAEMAMMMMVGNLVATMPPLASWHAALLVVALMFVVRPLAVELALIGSCATRMERRMMDWFGIRGIGTVYYLAYALEHGPRAAVRPLAPLALAVVTASVFVHGISATPLMRRYQRADAPRRK